MSTIREEYFIYIVAMKVLGFLTVLATVFLVYLVIFKSEKLTFAYRIQLAYNIIM